MQDTTMAHTLAEQKERLMHDLRVVMADAEELLRSTAGEVGGQSSEMRSRLLSRLSQARRGQAAHAGASVTEFQWASQRSM